jgi:hypothetical protein
MSSANCTKNTVSSNFFFFPFLIVSVLFGVGCQQQNHHRYRCYFLFRLLFEMDFFFHVRTSRTLNNCKIDFILQMDLCP